MEALEKSIQHWKKNVEAEDPHDVSVSAGDCALCRIFLRENCNGCPVKKRTGQNQCRATPYERAHWAWETWLNYPNDGEAKAAWREAAQIELNFLESLREA